MLFVAGRPPDFCCEVLFTNGGEHFGVFLEGEDDEAREAVGSDGKLSGGAVSQCEGSKVSDGAAFVCFTAVASCFGFSFGKHFFTMLPSPFMED